MNTYSSLGEQEKLMIRSQIHSSFPIIQAVIEGTQQGRIFKSAHQDYWVLHKAGFSEVFLSRGDGKELVDFIGKTPWLPKYFHIYSPPEQLVNVFKSDTKIFNIRERDRVQLKYDGRKVSSSLLVVSDEFTSAEVTQHNIDSLAVFNLDLENKFWSSKEDFVKHAAGVFIKDKQHNPVSLCYAAAVADQKAEIDVVTNALHRGKGFAKAVVGAFIIHCNNYKIIPNWDCFEDNTASLMTAKKLNFLFNKKYKLLSIFKND
jgi:RimJ/RimL family protein N-acetyltransferase